MSNVKQVIVVRTDLNMRKGKFGAQVAHASMQFLLDANQSDSFGELHVVLTPEEIEWLSGSFTKIVVGVDSESALNELVLRAKMSDITVYQIVDSGKTEFNGVPTLTCAAFGPNDAADIDKITGHLKLILQRAHSLVAKAFGLHPNYRGFESLCAYNWKHAREAEEIGLLNRRPRKGSMGSNPIVSSK